MFASHLPENPPGRGLQSRLHSGSTGLEDDSRLAGGEFTIPVPSKLNVDFSALGLGRVLNRPRRSQCSSADRTMGGNMANKKTIANAVAREVASIGTGVAQGLGSIGAGVITGLLKTAIPTPSSGKK